MNDQVWKSSCLVQRYLEGVRGAIPLAQTQLEVMLELLRSRQSRPIRRFLDLGCGDGALGAALLAAFPRARGVFVDFSAPMLAACRAKLPAQRARPILLDYGQRGWPAAVRQHGPFDAVVSGFSIHHQPDARKRELYREILGLLRPRGWFVNIEHVAPAGPLTTELFDQRMVAAIQASKPDQSRAAIRRQYVRRADKAANILAPVEQQCRWLRRCGFVDVDCYLKIHELAVFGGRRRA